MDRKFGHVLLAAALLLCFGATAFAGKVFVTPKVGTTGPGLDLGYAISPKVKARINANGILYSEGKKVDDISYDIDLGLYTLGALIDWHPLGDGFRISGGLYYLGHEVDMDADLDPAETYHVGGKVYTGAEIGKLDGDMRYNDMAPYLGVGWGTGQEAEDPWFVSFDVGLMYIGQGKADLDAEDPLGVMDPAALEDEEDDIENELENLYIYPVISVGVGYRF